MITQLQLICGVSADLAFGDPRWLPHPIVAIGKFSNLNEKLWRKTGLPLTLAGIGAWLTVVASASGFVAATLYLLPQPYIQIYWIYSLLAARSLDQHAMAVVSQLRSNNLTEARAALGMIVGRDTAHLNEGEITRAVIETVAENLSDGVVAPLFWLLIAGPTGMAAYKAINTLDSMFGYRNTRYREFGSCSARVDDLANYIPARLTAGLIWIVAFFHPALNAKAAIRVTLRDAHLQPSPNSGYPEAAAAGALGIQLGGTCFYGGIESQKATLGDPDRPLTWRIYPQMRFLLYATSLAFTAAGFILCR
jgi:adenosylcobinamide-phosphate synthase